MTTTAIAVSPVPVHLKPANGTAVTVTAAAANGCSTTATCG